jgi:hypothetical protein
MRRLPTFVILVLVFALLALTPVAAAPAEQGTEVMIAVPEYIPVNGELDLVVFSGQVASMMEVLVFRFRGDKVSEAQGYTGDQHAIDQFWF